MVDEAFKAVETIPKDYNFKTNIHVMTCLVSACLANRANDRALEVFDRMFRDPNMENPDWKTFSVLIQGLGRAGWFAQAVALVEQGYGVTPDGSRCSGGLDMDPAALPRLLDSMVKMD